MDGLQRPALKRGASSNNIEELVRKLTQEPIPLLDNVDDNADLTAAIAKLNSGSILHTEKRAIERLLAQRYEEALAAAAASNQKDDEPLGGASDVLRQILLVFRQNNLPTELDRSTAESPAEWRVRAHAARRRAFLVVRSMVRLKREVKRLGAPITDLGWLLPVAAMDRWGELKALAARYRQLEGVLGDAQLAINQLSQIKEMQAKAAAPPKTGARGSPTRGGPRAGGTPNRRISNTGNGRAVSESGALNSRSRMRTPLTADPPPPPTAGIRAGRANRNGTLPGTGTVPAVASPLRTPLGGRKGGAGGADIAVIHAGPGPHGHGGGSLVPTMSPLRSPSLTNSGPGPSPFGRISNSGGGAPMNGGMHGGMHSGGGILSSAPATPLSGGPPPLQLRTSNSGMAQPGPVNPVSPAALRAAINPRPMLHSNTLVVRQTFVTGDGSLPPVSPGAGPRPHALPDLTSPGPNGSDPHDGLSPSGAPGSGAPEPSPSGAHAPPSPSIRTLGMGKPAPAPGAPGAAAVSPDTARPGPGVGTSRNWTVNVEPSPPNGPGPQGARRPVAGTLHPSPLSMQPSIGLPTVPSVPNGGVGPIVPRLPAIGSISGAAPTDGAPASVAPVLPVLIQDGESLDQALVRFQLAADDAKGALVDTARAFRQLLDRCNSYWPDQRWWLAAHTQEEAAQDSWTTSEEYTVNRADTVRCLKAGSVAFQFICYTDEPLVGPTGNKFDLWTSDPWEVAADLAPDAVYGPQGPAPHPLAVKSHQATPAAREPPKDAPERTVGMPLGVRILQQLANSVAEAAGPLALEALPIILHISEKQQESIAADLLQYSIYRRLRKNLFLVIQRAQPVMRFDPETHAYTPATDQPSYTPGNGMSMLQLLWPGYAMIVNDVGELERLPHSVMAELKRRNTEWFVSRSCHDLSLLQEDGALDLRTLAHVGYMWNQPHLRYSMAIESASTYVKHRDLILQHGSVLLCRKPKVLGMVVGKLDGAVRVDRYGGGTKAQLPVVELLTCELNSAHMQHELEQIAAARASTTSVGMGRYTFRFEVLAKLLTGPTVLRPKLFPVIDAKCLTDPNAPGGIMHMAAAAAAAASGLPSLASAASAPTRADASPGASLVDTIARAAAAGVQTGAMIAPPGGTMGPFPLPGAPTEQMLAHAATHGMDTLMLRLHFTMTDLSMHHMIKVVSLRAHRAPIFVRGPQDGQTLVDLLKASDVDLKTATQRLAAKLPSFSRQQKPGQSILVFDNGVSLTATNVAVGMARRERGDRIHLVTIVPTEVQRGEGQALLDRMTKALRTSTDITSHVLSQEGRGLLECVQDVMSAHKCGLLVVGSQSITGIATPAARPGAPPGTASKPPGTATKAPGTAAKAVPGTAMPAAAGGILSGDDGTNDLLLSSVALSILRTFALPVILVTANTRTYLKRTGNEPVGKAPARPAVGGVGGATAGRLGAMAVVERHSRPMMHHLTRYLLEPSLRQDQVHLAQVLPAGMAPGNKDYDHTSIQAVALKTLMANFESIASANDFHTPHKVHVQGEWQNALVAAARDNGAQLLALQLAPGMTRSLSPAFLQLIRAAPCPVLVYPERVMVPGQGVLVGEGEGDE
ncbi:hypothetical protein HYH03_003051 [Edaphochlamys debaryana]|uniref:Uncharacterized protein n=1 Tax=Edaphochlamys debaryana TaxID=47281 RepID=A0A835YJK8_9CHLO|nr:hypothetical protein HYH03_003051 [Edaphochlamys debaryana]|eukprot:KAG2498859.1 hypothetical protein HYH03_003051 [Edaphochlamys debaryana]